MLLSLFALILIFDQFKFFKIQWVKMNSWSNLVPFNTGTRRASLFQLLASYELSATVNVKLVDEALVIVDAVDYRMFLY